jgi:hypothetical protein
MWLICVTLGYGGFELTIGKLFVSTCGVIQHDACFPFGWFDIYWDDDCILELGDK